MKKISITCESCGNIFERETKEYNRAIKKGWKCFCSRSCAGKQWIKNFGNKANRDTSHLKKYTRADQYTGLRKFIRSINNRVALKNKTKDITLEELKEIWDKQEGICPITGWKMTLRMKEKQRKQAVPNQASLDRIDHTKGYIKGNLRFVSLMANYCRNTFSDEQVLDFCSAVWHNTKK